MQTLFVKKINTEQKKSLDSLCGWWLISDTDTGNSPDGNKITLFICPHHTLENGCTKLCTETTMGWERPNWRLSPLQKHKIAHTNTHKHTQAEQLCGVTGRLMPDWWGKSVNWISHACTVSSACVRVCVVLCPYIHIHGFCLKHHLLSPHQHSLLGCEAATYSTFMFDTSCKVFPSSEAWGSSPLPCYYLVALLSPPEWSPIASVMKKAQISACMFTLARTPWVRRAVFLTELAASLLSFCVSPPEWHAAWVDMAPSSNCDQMSHE